AARTLGESRLSAFRRVTLPGIAPGIAAGALLVGFYTLSDFGTPMILGFDVFTRAIFLEFQALNRGFAALLSLVLLVITLAVLAGESRLGTSVEGAHVAPGDRDAGRLSLGRWRWPAVAVPAGVALVALTLPLGILVMWLFRTDPGYAEGGYAFQLVYVWNSVGVAVAAALVSVLVGLPLAHLAQGRAILAFSPDAQVVGSTTRGASAVAHGEARQEAIASARHRGFSLGWDDIEPGLVEVAAPVRDAHGTAVGALGVIAPASRLPRPARLGPRVRTVAQEVSRRLGAQ
ncbi:MAG: hypothetical protein BRC32_00750, partial [Actinobacteria bacterium QS_8_72_14]